MLDNRSGVVLAAEQLGSKLLGCREASVQFNTLGSTIRRQNTIKTCALIKAITIAFVLLLALVSCTTSTPQEIVPEPARPPSDVPATAHEPTLPPTDVPATAPEPTLPPADVPTTAP
jgi:hypothetical protein